MIENKITYYEEQVNDIFTTTAIYPNREKDKKLIDEMIGLIESGSPYVKFYTRLGLLLAVGYIRIVYGDHGPYIEFLKNQIYWESLECERSGIGYYNKWYPKDGWDILIYEQRINVKQLCNPPKNGYIGNRSLGEGYADYRAGRVYINPYDLVIEL